MAIEIDNGSASGLGTSQLSWTHNPTGTPRGVLVGIVQDVTSGDQVSGVSYGDISMNEVTGSPFLHPTGLEDATLYAFFLGSSIPTGPQVVNVNVTAANNRRAAAYTVTAATDTVVDSAATVEGSAIVDPSVTITVTSSASYFAMSMLHSGQNTNSATTIGAAWTQTWAQDFGNATAKIGRISAITFRGAGEGILANYTGASEEGAVFAVAIRQTSEDAGGGVTDPGYYRRLIQGYHHL